MSTKVKGLLKGIKYISHQIFDEEKEAEIQIGFPTDVKHVAHIGWDGPSAVDNPSWMKDFKGAAALKSAPLGPPTDSKENNPEIKWVSEDSKGRRAARSESRDGGGEGSTRPSRRHSSSNDNDAAAACGGDSPKSSKPRQSRRHKSSSDGTKSKDPSAAADGPDVPKKSRRKKSKDFSAADGSSVRSTRSSRSSVATTAGGGTPDPDPDPTALPQPSTSSKHQEDDGENYGLFESKSDLIV